MSLASIYSARGKHEMAEPLLQQVLEWRAAGTNVLGAPLGAARSKQFLIDAIEDLRWILNDFTVDDYRCYRYL